MIDLKPCPFCGGKDLHIHGSTCNVCNVCSVVQKADGMMNTTEKKWLLPHGTLDMIQHN